MSETNDNTTKNSSKDKQAKRKPVSTSTSASKKKKTTATAALSQTELTPLQRLFPNETESAIATGSSSSSSYKYKIITWNVAGLRALIKNHPMALSKLATEHNADAICLQETKLQPDHVYDDKLKLQQVLKEEGYKSYFSCCSVKKGYSGTAVFLKDYGMEQRGDEGNCNDNDKDNNDKDATMKKKKKTTQTTLNFTSKQQDSTTTVITKKTHPSTSHPLLNDVEFIQQNLIPKRITYSMNTMKTNDDDDDETNKKDDNNDDNDSHDPEGRIICVELPKFFFVNLYVPNSGQKLERLEYRIQNWDKALSEFMHNAMVQWKKPGIWLGDLNVAHKEKDVWNYGAKHLLKQAGCTLEERASFDDLLRGYGYVQNKTGEEDEDNDRLPIFRDVFRTLHPNASGHYSYWSQRAGNRLPNKGLRLDYFVAHGSMFASDHHDDDDDDTKKKKKDNINNNTSVVVRDSYMLPDVQGSDHCPCVLELELFS